VKAARRIAATAAIREVDASARVLIFSTFARDDEIQAALDAGALGYLQKSASREELLAAIQCVAQGKRYLQPELAKRLNALRLGPAITPREREILALIANGRANKEIAAALGLVSHFDDLDDHHAAAWRRPRDFVPLGEPEQGTAHWRQYRDLVVRAICVARIHQSQRKLRVA
jgi:FixJ family two-component response regulator